MGVYFQVMAHFVTFGTWAHSYVRFVFFATFREIMPYTLVTSLLSFLQFFGNGPIYFQVMSLLSFMPLLELSSYILAMSLLSVLPLLEYTPFSRRVDSFTCTWRRPPAVQSKQAHRAATGSCNCSNNEVALCPLYVYVTFVNMSRTKDQRD